MYKTSKWMSDWSDRSYTKPASSSGPGGSRDDVHLLRLLPRSLHLPDKSWRGNDILVSQGGKPRHGARDLLWLSRKSSDEAPFLAALYSPYFSSGCSSISSFRKILCPIRCRARAGYEVLNEALLLLHRPFPLCSLPLSGSSVVPFTFKTNLCVRRFAGPQCLGSS